LIISSLESILVILKSASILGVIFVFLINHKASSALAVSITGAFTLISFLVILVTVSTPSTTPSFLSPIFTGIDFFSKSVSIFFVFPFFTILPAYSITDCAISLVIGIILGFAIYNFSECVEKEIFEDILFLLFFCLF